MKPSICVIVFSYNRPVLLNEALASIRGADQVIVADDGSEFVSEKLTDVPDAKVKTVIQGTRRSPWERAQISGLGGLANKALGLVETDLVTYLCDDDLFHPDWLKKVKKWPGWDFNEHWLVGRWLTFKQGEAPSETGPPSARITTGNFVHHIKCFREEKISWPAYYSFGHDDYFVHHARALHGLVFPMLWEVAGWRREHDYAVTNIVSGQDPTTALAKAILHGPLEPRNLQDSSHPNIPGGEQHAAQTQNQDPTPSDQAQNHAPHPPQAP